MLIAARALLGIGGATLMPSTLALIRNMFHDEKQRGTAVAIWTAGADRRHRARPGPQRRAAGALLVGLGLPDQRPGMVLLLALAPLLLPEFKNPAAGPLRPAQLAALAGARCCR